MTEIAASLAINTGALQALGLLLRRDDYAALQFVPFARHAPAYLAQHFKRLQAEEDRLATRVQMGQPVLYAYSIDPERYAQGLNSRQRALGELFLHGRPMARTTLLREIPEYLDLAMALCGDGDLLRCNFRLVPAFDALFVADPISSDAEDHVFLHNDSLHMASYLRQAGLHNRTVADVGTGTGILAQTAWTCGAKRVVGVDINPRALQFARFSQALNPGSAVSFRLGSVEDVVQQAEVIVSNPPYMKGRTALSLSGGGPLGLDTPIHFARVAAQHGRRLIMILELDQPGNGRDVFLEAVGLQPQINQLLRRRDGSELRIYEFA